MIIRDSCWLALNCLPELPRVLAGWRTLSRENRNVDGTIFTGCTMLLVSLCVARFQFGINLSVSQSVYLSIYLSINRLMRTYIHTYKHTNIHTDIHAYTHGYTWYWRGERTIFACSDLSETTFVLGPRPGSAPRRALDVKITIKAKLLAINQLGRHLARTSLAFLALCCLRLSPFV